MKARKYFLISVATMLLFTMNSQDAFCQWVDKSGDLPGISNGTGYLIAAGAVVTGGVIYLIVKNKKKRSKMSQVSWKMKQVTC